VAQIILQPASNSEAYKHFEDTVKKTVLASQIIPYLKDSSEKERFLKISKNKNVSVWGVTAGKNDVNAKKWQRIQPGDVTLFYREKFIFCSAVTTLKIHNQQLASSLWGFDERGATWEYIYFIDEVKSHNIPIKHFNKIVGYKDNYIIQGFNVLDESEGGRVLSSLDLFSNLYFQDVTKEEFNKLTKDDLSGPLDTKGLVNIRKEQSFLRKNLFKDNKEFKCGICDRLIPINLLVAAHIKKRAESTQEERRDYQNIVMSMCKFGCDDLFEKGYLGVIKGKIQINTSLYWTPDIREAVENLEGKVCKVWNNSNKSYFDWQTKRYGIQDPNL